MQFEKNFASIPIFGLFDKISIQMNKNTSISLGNYFDQFVQSGISEGRFKNVSEVIRAGLRLLEEEESKVIALKAAIQEGIDSGIAHDFDPKKHLESLKAKKTLEWLNINWPIKLSRIYLKFGNTHLKFGRRNKLTNISMVLFLTAKRLLTIPILGKNYEGISNQLLGLKTNRNIIFYRTLEKDYIEITRILHERMDLKKKNNRIKNCTQQWL